jgi:hypothetical protein
MTEANIESDEIDLEPFEDDNTTNFSDNDRIPVEHVNFEFAQVNKLQGISRKLTVFNDTHCYQSIKNKHQRKFKYRIDLVRTVRWKWLYASLALWVLDLVLVFKGWLETSSVTFLGLFIGTPVVALMTLMAFFYYSRDTVFFRTQYGKIKLVEVINKNPDTDSFRSFITKFVMQINKCKTAKGFNQNKFLARELQELRRLKDETVIPEASYEKAKRLIFKHEAFSATD